VKKMRIDQLWGVQINPFLNSTDAKSHNAFGIVYVAINRKNGKKYVGQTIKPFGTRISQHYSEKKQAFNKYFQAALRKYPKKDWAWVVLRACRNGQELDAHEIRFIRKFGTNANRAQHRPEDSLGYNLSDGGGGRRGPASEAEKATRKRISIDRWADPIIRQKWVEGIRKKAKDPASRKKKSDSNKGIPKTKEHVEKVREYWKQHPSERAERSEAMSGQRNPMWSKKGGSHPAFGRKQTDKAKEVIRKKMIGRTFSPETLEKMSKSRKGLLAGARNPMFGKGHLREGNKNAMFGKTHTKETRKKLSESTLKQFKNKGHPRAIPIEVFDEHGHSLGRFKSKSEAMLVLGVSRKVFEKKLNRKTWRLDRIERVEP